VTKIEITMCGIETVLMTGRTREIVGERGMERDSERDGGDSGSERHTDRNRDRGTGAERISLNSLLTVLKLPYC
jgi:hypothetical protein